MRKRGLWLGATTIGLVGNRSLESLHKGLILLLKFNLMVIDCIQNNFTRTNSHCY